MGRMGLRRATEEAATGAGVKGNGPVGTDGRGRSRSRAARVAERAVAADGTRQRSSNSCRQWWRGELQGEGSRGEVTRGAQAMQRVRRAPTRRVAGVGRVQGAAGVQVTQRKARPTSRGTWACARARSGESRGRRGGGGARARRRGQIR